MTASNITIKRKLTMENKIIRWSIKLKIEYFFSSLLLSKFGFTKQEKIYMYNHVLDYLTSITENTGICLILYKTYGFNPFQIAKFFPELYAYKGDHLVNTYWFNSSEERLNAVKQILKDLKDEKEI